MGKVMDNWKSYYKPVKYKAMKYLIETKTSWAVFLQKDVAGLKSPIRNPKIKPLISKVSQAEARAYIKELLKKEEEKK